MKITVLRCPNSKYGPYHVVYGLDAWPAGTRRNRGWENASVVYEREATEGEMMEQRTAYRYICYRYQTWSGLVEDEMRAGVDVLALALPTMKD